MSTGTKSARTAGIGLALGVLATALIYQHAVGLGASLYVIIWLALLVAHGRWQGKAFVPRNLLLLIPTVFFALMPVIRSDPMLLTLNVMAGAGALLLFTYFFANGNFAMQGLFDYPKKALISAADVLFQPMQDFFESIKWLAVHRRSLRGVAPVLRGAAISIPLVA